MVELEQTLRYSRLWTGCDAGTGTAAGLRSLIHKSYKTARFAPL